MKSRQRQIRTEGSLEGFQALSSGGAHHGVEGGSVLPSLPQHRVWRPGAYPSRWAEL